jgi:cysteinyl-tRNA synthetase
MYVCGVTPYAVTHLGHAFSYVQFDTLRRYLGFLGYEVRHVQNVTDIDDDMIMVSRRQGGRPIAEIRDENLAVLERDLARLNVLAPSVTPYATEHIPRIISLVEATIARGVGYVVAGDVFFEVGRFAHYGQLSGASLAELAARENPEAKHQEVKRGPLDFLLWQAQQPGEPAWDSPWGPGRPGWSIECTAMSTAHLGEQIDIHGGGRDLVFPHHENEIAQAETVTGKHPFCGSWLHNGMLRLDGVKMSKSLGNLVLASDLLSRFDADHVRLYLLSAHYRADVNYTSGSIPALGERYGRLVAAAGREDHPEGGAAGASALRTEFQQAMDEDFDVPAGLDVLERAAVRVLEGVAGPVERADLRTLLAVLGFRFAGAPGRPEPA